MASLNKYSQSVLLAFIFAVGLFASNVASSRLLSSELSMTERHEQWIKQYGRVYKNAAEKQRRFEIFKKNIEYIENMNKMNRSFSLGLNAFTDLTNEEFRASHNGYRRPASSLRSTFFKYENFTDVPSSVDWVANGAVTPVKNQGQCGKHPYSMHRFCYRSIKCLSNRTTSLHIKKIISKFLLASFAFSDFGK
ncbi:hypothetical protein Droror1_Dr00011945 [Drosera rotundifolia]